MRAGKGFILAFPALTAILGVWIRAKPGPAPPDVSETARSYRSLHRMTPPEGVRLNSELAKLCIGVSRQQVDAALKTAGPHAYTQAFIYMNGPAARTFRERGAGYPVDSVIVKEKRGLPYESARTPDGVGGMIKRPPGYDPGHGDWEYFYFEDPARIEHGRIASCVGCHAGADRDFVFGDWARRPTSP